MGANCSKQPSDAHAAKAKKKHVLKGGGCRAALVPQEEPEMRTSARFLAPETRRAGSTPSGVIDDALLERTSCEALAVKGGSVDLASEELHFCTDTGVMTWNCQKVGALFLEQQRGGREEASTGDAGGAAPAGPSGSSQPVAFSPHFTLPSAGSQLAWRLMWVLRDVNDFSASLYLQCLNPEDKVPAGDPLEALFRVGVKKRRSAGRKDSPAGASLEMDLSHTFTREEATWGVQEMVAFEEAGDFVESGTGRMQVQLSLVLVSSVPPSLSYKPPHDANKFRVQMVSAQPRILLIDNFLSEEDCEQLIRLAAPDLQRSRVATGTETPSRTSYGTFLTGKKESSAVVLKVEDKIAKCMNKPCVLKDGGSYRKHLTKSEALQVVRYRSGEFYNEHYDNKAGNASHRAATFMVYLSDVSGGGATYFPRSTGRPAPSATPSQSTNQRGSFWNSPAKSNPPGLRIYPKQGRAVLFWSRTSAGSEDMSSIHAAEAVGQGEKWIMTRWMKEVDGFGG